MIVTRRQWLAGGAALVAGAARAAPGEPDAFAAALRQRAGAISPAALRTRLEREHRTLSVRAQRLFDRLGHPPGTLYVRYAALFRDERYLYPDTDAGRAAAVADMTAMLTHLRAALPALIDPVPALGDLTIRALTPAEIAAGRGGYRAPGAYVVDLKDIRRRPRWTLPSVVAHETVPGHLLQSALEPAPPATADAAGFTEGWAIYAEALVRHADPLNQLGQLHWLLFRLARARADLGIHTEGWSLDEAHARLVAWQGEPVYFAPFATELARIAREPGQRAADAAVWLAIADRARGRSGAALRRFHHDVLLGGRKLVQDLPA